MSSPFVFAVVLVALLAAPAAGALAVPLLSPSQTLLVGMDEGAGSAVTALVEKLGGKVVTHLAALNTLLVSGLAADALRGLPGVSFVESDGRATSAGAQWNGAQWNGAQWNGAQWNGNESQGASWGLRAIRAPQAWANASAAQTTLCVVDSGVDLDHPGLVVGEGFNAIDTSRSADDDAGHGTHVAGIAAARRNDGDGVDGVANARILPAKALKSDGTGLVSDVVEGMSWCAEKRADVVLLALSIDTDMRTMDRALRHLESRGVLVVASVGNGGPCDNCVAYPASDNAVLAVGAITRAGTLASFSASGAEMDVVAPGEEILSTWIGGGTRGGSGTSQAAAYAAGAALLVAATHPDLPPSGIRAAITSGSASGLLDADGAVREG